MSRPRLRDMLAAAITGLVAAGAVLLAGPTAHAATLLSDDFEDGNANGWSKSGGEWSVVSDGSLVLRQSKLGSSLARQFNGSTSWADYTVQARVRPLAFDGTGRFVAIAARSTSATKMYRLALFENDRVELQAVNGSSINVIGSQSLPVTTGTWYPADRAGRQHRPRVRRRGTGRRRHRQHLEPGPGRAGHLPRHRFVRRRDRHRRRRPAAAAASSSSSAAAASSSSSG